jgi:hypothetical protein
LAEAKADLKQALKDNRVLTAYIRTKEEKARKQKEAEEARKLREAVEEARKKQEAGQKDKEEAGQKGKEEAPPRKEEAPRKETTKDMVLRWIQKEGQSSKK